MLGDSLLVAPVFNEEGMAEYYLPEGTWTNFLTGETRQGGRWYREKHGYLSIPLYARENSIIAVGASDDGPEYDYADGVTFKVYAPEAGGETGTVVYDGKGRQDTVIQVDRKGNVCKIDVTGDKPCKVELVNMGTPAEANGVSCETKGETIVLSFEKGGLATVVLK